LRSAISSRSTTTLRGALMPIHLRAVDRHDRHLDLFTDAQSFAGAACEYEHRWIYSCKARP